MCEMSITSPYSDFVDYNDWANLNSAENSNKLHVTTLYLLKKIIYI